MSGKRHSITSSSRDVRAGKQGQAIVSSALVRSKEMGEKDKPLAEIFDPAKSQSKTGKIRSVFMVYEYIPWVSCVDFSYSL